jgi:hypothetical protein
MDHNEGLGVGLEIAVVTRVMAKRIYGDDEVGVKP